MDEPQITVNIAALAAAQRAYREVQDNPVRAEQPARALRALPGGVCRHCGALNTGEPHSWHAFDCPRNAREAVAA